LSPFFDKAFNGSFREGKEGKMNLPEDDETTFETFLGWAYLKVLGETDEDKEDRALWSVAELLDLYLFAKKILCLRLQNAVMDLIQDEIYMVSLEMTLEDVVFMFKGCRGLEELPLGKFCIALIHCGAFGGYGSYAWDTENVSHLFKNSPEMIEPHLEFLFEMGEKSMGLGWDIEGIPRCQVSHLFLPRAWIL
jgi:hypothetical protein